MTGERGKVGAGAGLEVELARLAHPLVHNSALIHEVVTHRLDKAGVRLGALVGARRRLQLGGLGIRVPVALSRAGDAVGPVQTGVEPLRRVRRSILRRQHVAELVVERFRILIAAKVPVLFAPVRPAAGETIEDLARVSLRPCYGVAALRHLRVAVVVELRHSRLAEVLLDQHVDRHLRPVLGCLDTVHRKDEAPVGVSNLRGSIYELDGFVRVFSGACEATRHLHALSSTSPSATAFRHKPPPKYP